MPDGLPVAHDRTAGVPEFLTTRWSVVLQAGGTGAAAESALERLCRHYWYPLYVFVRRRGYAAAEAQDLTQEFFARLLAGETLQTADPEKGRFRSFLLSVMKHFLINVWRDANRQKRGGGREILSWDGLEAEERFQSEPATDDDETATFDRRWARAVVTAALERIRTEMERNGEGERFAILQEFLQGDAGESYAGAAQALRLSEPAVKSAIFRMRRRYGQYIREEIMQTVAAPDQVDDEIRHLISVIARG
ncbi:MAG: sigma-70 family RNA polymerase sigma factor [Verrucomicrobiales bacterium]|nr:sigma-70 family RNA polymerase sigma factor [Verrucomicrobiales bacterium]